MGQSKSRDQIDAISTFGGMSYSIFDEQMIMKGIVDRNYDINFTSQYADSICKNNALNIGFLKEQFSEDIKIEDASEKWLNPTSIGNIAYIATNSPPPYDQKAFRAYNVMVQYCKSKL